MIFDKLNKLLQVKVSESETAMSGDIFFGGFPPPKEHFDDIFSTQASVTMWKSKFERYTPSGYTEPSKSEKKYNKQKQKELERQREKDSGKREKEYEPSLCKNCGAGKAFPNVDGELKECGRCRSAKYCSPSCQKTDWKFHKKECKPKTVERKDLIKGISETPGMGLQHFAEKCVIKNPEPWHFSKSKFDD